MIEKTKESKDGKTLQHTSVFERIQRLRPRVSMFKRLGRKDESESSKQVKGDANISNTSIVYFLGTKIKSLSEKRLLEHEKHDFCGVINNKEIQRIFPSCMKRKTILSMTTYSSLKVKRNTIVVTN